MSVKDRLEGLEGLTIGSLLLCYDILREPILVVKEGACVFFDRGLVAWTVMFLGGVLVFGV